VALYKSDAVVISRRNLGESDRLVEFYTRDFGKVRGVAKGARRPRSRFGSALETFTRGRLLFFDTGRSELVRIDHFDILESFIRVREHLERLGRGAWVVECLARLSAERDSHPALYRLLVRSLVALEGPAGPGRVAACFGLRAFDLTGHRPRIDRCVSCGRPYPFPGAGLDVGEGGLTCASCGTGGHPIPMSEVLVATVGRLRGLRWDEALRLPLAPRLDEELTALLEAAISRLIGQVPRSLRFMAQTRRGLSMVAEPAPAVPGGSPRSARLGAVSGPALPPRPGGTRRP